ncbi:MAG TPA: hypothetical protein VMX15_00980 [Candidatus Heimdallarchaeota archaeon]|nr:hypothetical protein [Candidatus Heimdallarchaeota archaeon]
MERIRIETGSRTETATSNMGAWKTGSSVTRWCECVPITPAQAVNRYDVPFDKQLMYEFRFFDKPTITLRNTRFVWVTNGHANCLKVYWPRSTPINIDGEGRRTSVLAEETEETVDE